MAAPRLVVELSIGKEDVTQLTAIARSRTEPASRGERARILLAYRDDPSFFAVGRLLGVHHQPVQRCVERAAGCGALVALDDSPRPGKKPAITAEAKEWLVALACRKVKDLVIPMSFGRPGCWPAMRANMRRPPGMPALLVWSRARSARSSTRMP